MIKDDTIYLRHILDAIKQIEAYVAGMDQGGFLDSRLVQDAVIRQFEIIGEATKNLSPDIRERFPDIPWKDMAGMRDKLIHQYFGVDIAAIWATITQDLPSLKREINGILATNS